MATRLEFSLRGTKDGVTAATFVAATRLFLALLEEIEGTVTEKTANNIVWAVADLRFASATIVLEAIKTEKLAYSADEIAGPLVEGLHILETEAKRPPFFSDTAIRYANRLATMSGRDAGEILVSTSNAVAVISSTLAPNTTALLGTSIEEMGTVEGVLKMVTIAGTPRFNVYDSITGMAITCGFGGAHLRSVAVALGRRVSVSGRLIYTRDGYPARIRDITEFDVLAEDRDLPTANDVLKTGLDLAGGSSLEDFMEKRRNVRT